MMPKKRSRQDSKIRSLYQDKFSQEEMARKIDMPIASFRRMENRPLQKIPVGVLKQIGEALQIYSLDEIMGFLEERQNYDFDQKKAFFKRSYGNGVFHSYLPKNLDFSFGELRIQPGSNIAAEFRMKSSNIAFLVTFGSVKLKLSSQDKVYSKGQGFGVAGAISYELQNANKLQSSCLIVAASPAIQS